MILVLLFVDYDGQRNKKYVTYNDVFTDFKIKRANGKTHKDSELGLVRR